MIRSKSPKQVAHPAQHNLHLVAELDSEGSSYRQIATITSYPIWLEHRENVVLQHNQQEAMVFFFS